MCKIVLSCFFTLIFMTVSAVPNMFDYSGGNTINGLFSGEYSSDHCETKICYLEGNKVAIGFEPLSETTVIIGTDKESGDSLYCKLIDKKGTEFMSAAYVGDISDAGGGILKFTFVNFEENYVTYCTCRHLKISNPEKNSSIEFELSTLIFE